MKSEYLIITKEDSLQLGKILIKDGEFLKPLDELIASSRKAAEELLDRLARMILETALLISLSDVAGQIHQGRKAGDIVRHGAQLGSVILGGRNIRVRKPRLRVREEDRGREILIPTYEAMKNDPALGANILKIILKGVSAGNYKRILPKVCGSLGVSKSSVSREVVESCEAECKKLLERRFDDLEIPMILIDGIMYGEHKVIGAVGVDRSGDKHVLGVMEGATTNTSPVKALLKSLVERGISPSAQRLFVIDGSKALRTGIGSVFGYGNPV